MTVTPRRELRAINGVFLLDKASGYSSNASLQKVRRFFQARKAGHTGSLDPLASGLLPVCFGEATKLSSYLLDTDKRYEVRVRLGAETDTADVEGTITVVRPVPELSRELIEQVLEVFRGAGSQIPPMYSALKHEGQRLYDLARKGVEVDRPARPITIYELNLLGFDATSLHLEVHCSKGTYIRTLAEDVGRALQCGGHVEMLRRTRVGSFDITAACTVDQLESMGLDAAGQQLVPMDRLVDHMPVVELDQSMSLQVCQGKPVWVPHELPQGWVRLYAVPTTAFLGLGEVLDDGRIGPRRMFMGPQQFLAAEAAATAIQNHTAFD